MHASSALDRYFSTIGLTYALMTVVEVRSYSLISGNTSALMHKVTSGATRAATRFDQLLVHRVEVGVDEANGDRFYPFVDQLPDRPRGIGLSQRSLDPASGVDPLVDLDSQMALDQRRRLGPRQVVEPRHPQGADLEDVAKALCRDQAGTGALQFEDGVRGDRGAVQQLDDLGRPEGMLADQRGEPPDDRRRVIVDSRGNLLGQPLAVLTEKDDVGESAADVDADPIPGHAYSAAIAVTGGSQLIAGVCGQLRVRRSRSRRARVAASSTAIGLPAKTTP